MITWNKKLITAVNNCSTYDIKQCLLNGADIHFAFDYTIKTISEYDCLDLLKYILNNYEFSDYTIIISLNKAIIKNKIKNVKFLIDKCSDINEINKYFVMDAFNQNKFEMITLLFECGYNIPINTSKKNKKLYSIYLRNKKINKIYEKLE